MADPRIKQLKIKTGVVQRTRKEYFSYEKEVKREEERFESKREKGADEYELKKQKEVIQESKDMLPDTMRRLKTAKDQLLQMLKIEEDLKETEEYKKAEEALTEVVALEEQVAKDTKTSK